MRPVSSIVSILLLCVALVACAGAGAGPRERRAERLMEFEQYAGAPVRDFHFFRNIDRWEGLGDYTVAVWTRANEAWLIRVKRPCNGLAFATTLALSSSNNRVHQGFDAVLFENERCRIDEIRPVDGKALKASRRARAASGRDG